MEWLRIRQGWMHGRLAVVPTLPCQYLRGNDCMIHDHKPPFCVDYPGKQEDCVPEWMEAMGCKYFEEEVQDAVGNRETEDSCCHSETPPRETLQEKQGDVEDVERAVE